MKRTWIIAGVVVALFAVLAVKAVTSRPDESASAEVTGTSLTSVRNDATADYAAAVKSGKPVYVLFHSLT